MHTLERRSTSPWAGVQPGAILAFLLLLFQFGVNLSGGYGYFRDEFYYLACSDHLAWGYPDHPPFSILVLWLNRLLIGDSIFSLRFIPAVAGAGLVYLTGLVTRELGGGRPAQYLACLAVVFAPVYLAMYGFYSMNMFEPLFWTGAGYVLIRIIRTGDDRLWLLFGALAGLGLQNKLGMLFFGSALVLGLAVSAQRKHIVSTWFLAGGLVAVIVFLPYILWQMTHDWATLEFMENARQLKNVPMSPLDFLSAQVLFQHPVVLPLWLAGLVALFFHRDLRTYQCFGTAFLVLFVLFVVQNGKPYYLSPIYPVLLSAGAVVFGELMGRRVWKVVMRSYVAILVVAGLITLPLWVPVLPVETYVRYSDLLGLHPPRMERHRDTVLPQIFADRFGWKEMVGEVARAYESLTPEERSQTTIYTQNYGEAGAIDFFGREYKLPGAISGHNSYWLWGIRDTSATTAIIVGGRKKDHEKVFGSVRIFLVHQHQYAMPYETDLPIYICRNPKVSLKEIWQKVKIFI